MTPRDGILAGYRGHVDAVEPVLAGWVAEIARPRTPVTLRLSIDRGPGIAVTADRMRPDVAASGLAGPYCGFAVELPPRVLDGAEHGLDLLVPDGRRLNLPGIPARVALGAVPADLVRAGAANIDAVLDLLARTDDEAGLDAALVSRVDAAAFNAIGPPDQGFMFYARAGARLVGYGRLDRGWGEGSTLGVVALTVLAAYRRKGLGEALMRALLGAAADEGLGEVWLAVRPDNTPALRLYEKLGFGREAQHPLGRLAMADELTMVWYPRGRAGP